MIGQTTQVDDLRLVALPSAVNCAEMFVRFALAEWSLRELVGEATRITRHLVSSSVEGSKTGAPRFLTVRLRVHGDALVIELDDDLTGEPPELPGAQINAVTLPGARRNVWSELPLPTGMSAAAVPLPQRSRNRTPPVEHTSEQPRVDADSQILQRVLYGLNRGNGGG
ncbi:hypothetical protein LWP59_14820 [Amycolatopsis acidiphila]|uniref:ATP-binding protein n=1 Tax=Amycolatopsis acidiphila TaxID=715473 RepID=A0A558AKM7_9PSEU|nr:hypothetical protein [Amycolatopsis acidiphila]TVT24822.1 hypothetical protein FNH06_05520 [Amycolatopsis acidiphila]UIJ62803.1 hypothetical protein LWP59_14820 [Amycolatopsis acidiphila]GHG64296.1 hypothetical protein GCM10017788_20900 [Amycolatopsis acidiphila]